MECVGIDRNAVQVGGPRPLWSPFRNLPEEVEEIHKTCRVVWCVHGVMNRAPPDCKTGYILITNFCALIIIYS